MANAEVLESDALDSLRLRFADAPEDSRVAVHTYTGNVLATRIFKPTELDAAARQFAGQRDGPNVYTRMSLLHKDRLPEHGRRGTKDASYGCCVLWSDIDPDGTEDFRERKLAELRAFHIPPSAIEDSGRGYYALWRIPFTTDWERVERINRWLGLQLGGEGFDVTRVLRLPGTFNGKPDAQRFASVLDCHPERVYSLDDFQEAEPAQAECDGQGLEYDAEALPLDFEQKVRATSLNLWRRIVSEEEAISAGAPVKSGSPPRVDRSRNDAYIATRLLGLSIPKEQVFTVLTHPTWFSGTKFREGYSESYVKRTIEHAAQWVGSHGNGRLHAPVVAGRITEQVRLLRYLTYWYGYDTASGVYRPYEQDLCLAIQGIAGERWTPSLEQAVLRYLEPNVTTEQLFDHDLINCRNGMLDWRTGQLHPHSSAYQSLYQVDADWEPTADCTAVDAFVSAILPDDLVPIFWMFSGYCLYTRTPLPYRALVALVGRKRTGKSTLLLALQAFLGQENCSAVSLAALAGSGNQFTTSALVGRLLNIDLDSPYEVPLKDNHALKKLAVGEPIQIERKHHQSETAALPVKLAFVMNHYPTFGVADEALYDRWIVLTTRGDVQPFTQDNTATRLNAHLALLSQAPNRAAWLRRSIEGLQVLEAAGGFPETEATKRGRDELRRESDSVYDFWLTCTQSTDQSHEVSFKQAYDAYRTWLGDTGSVGVKIKRFRSRTSEMLDTGLLPGMSLSKPDDRWVVGGRIVPRFTVGRHAE